MLVFFGVAFVITSILLYWYSGSFVITALALICAIVPVIWLLGLLPIFGLGLDPMSILVPFLIFSIAVSHAVQMTNAWKLETLHGADGVTASTHSFQKLFIPGAMALLANALGFMVIAFVDIEMVRELAYTATIGVTVMILTNKILLPILLSYYKFTPEKASKLAGKETAGDWLWERIGGLATKRIAWIPIAVALGLLAFGISQARYLHIGDLGKGVRAARELALQPGRRDDHESLRDRSRSAAGHRRGRAKERGRFALRRPQESWTGSRFRAQMRRRRRRDVRSPAGFVKASRSRSRRPLRNGACCRRSVRRSRRAGQGDAARQRVHEFALHGDAGQHLHDRPRDDDPAHRREDQGVRAAGGDTGKSRSSSRAATSADGGDERSRRSRGQVVNLALFASVMVLCLVVRLCRLRFAWSCRSRS